MEQFFLLLFCTSVFIVGAIADVPHKISYQGNVHYIVNGRTRYPKLGLYKLRFNFYTDAAGVNLSGYHEQVVTIGRNGTYSVTIGEDGTDQGILSNQFSGLTWMGIQMLNAPLSSGTRHYRLPFPAA